MMTITKRALSSMAALTLAGAALSVNAATTTYTFGTLFVGSGPASASFATLSIDASADNKTFVFDLKISSSLNALFGAGAFVSGLQVNTVSNDDPVSTLIASGSWGVQVVDFSANPANQGGVAWDFKDSFCGDSGGCNKNAAGSRLTQGEEVKWTSVFASAQNPLLAAPGLLLKVQGYNWNNASASADYVPVVSAVPEPEAFAMLLAGLGVMLGVVRRRRSLTPLAA